MKVILRGFFITCIFAACQYPEFGDRRGDQNARASSPDSSQNATERDPNKDEVSGHANNETDGDSDSQAELCDPNPAATPARLRRLTAFEYRQTIRALFGQAVSTQVSASLDLLPDDRDLAKIERTAQLEESTHFFAYQTVATAIAEQAVKGDIQELSSCNVSCWQTWIRTWGRRVFRRPLETAETARYLAVAQLEDESPTMRAETILAAMLASPSFFYLDETGRERADDESVIPLDNFQLLARVTYAVTAAPPSDELLDAAAQPDFRERLPAIVDELWQSEAAQTALLHTLDQWSGYKPKSALPVASTSFDADELRAAMVTEIETFLRRIVFADSGTFRDLMTDQESLISHESLAQVYGVSPSTSQQSLGRPGLLTRAALLVGDGGTTNPINRGARFLDHFLCRSLHLPVDNNFDPADLIPPEPDASKSSRQTWTDKTAATPCQACHAQINPVGFVFSEFDHLGQQLFGEELIVDGQSRLHAIDTQVEFTLDSESGPESFANAAAFTNALADSEVSQRCFSLKITMDAHALPAAKVDQCQVDRMQARIAEQDSLADVIKGIVLDPAFHHVYVAEE